MHQLTSQLHARLRLPLFAAPMFIVSTPELLLAQCRAGVIGSLPSLNARPAGLLAEWLQRLQDELTPEDAPYAVNLIVHRTNQRLEQDLAQLVHYRVPIVVTSLGLRAEIIDAVHGYGGIVFHDVIHDAHARKAIERGADGLVAVAAGAGGHAGAQSPFALVSEIRQWFDGPLALSGAIANGRSLFAAIALGADFGYVGSAFIATSEANAGASYQQQILDGSAADIVYSDLFTGVHGNYLKDSIRAVGLDPDHLPPRSDATARMLFDGGGRPKVWRDIHGAGQGIGSVTEVVPTAQLVARLQGEYRQAAADVAANQRFV